MGHGGRPPSDHYIREHRAFLSHIARAIALVPHFPTKIVLLGYLEPGPPLPGDAAAFRVASFVEKPTPEMAADSFAGVASGTRS
jgi:mannose-1-phosphate guanylyltransferase